jgi:hypothetical protein
VLVPSRPRSRWSLWWLAPVAAAIIAAGAYQLTHPKVSGTPQQVAQQPAPVQPPQPLVPAPNPPAEVAQSTTPKTTPPPSLNSPAPSSEHAATAPAENAATEVADNANPPREISPPPSADDQRFLTEVSSRSPGWRSTYEDQLRAVNGEIIETQDYIKRNPGDFDARQHLMEAYQQKAMLYQIALDHVQ